MRIIAKLAKWLLALLVVAVVAGGAWLHFSTPALIRGALAYSAKMVCSYQFIAGRDTQEVLARDVHEPAAHWLLRYISAASDHDERAITTRLFGVLGEGRAVHRDGFGCVTVPQGSTVAAMTPPVPATADKDALWLQGERVELSQDAELQSLLTDEALVGPGMRAVVIVRDGRIVAERYGTGFSADTPLLGWSMTKTITAAIIGTLIKDDRLSLEQDGLFEEWSGDERSAITVADLMAMSSGLAFNEDYGGLTDVTRMLYLEPDMAAFAAGMPLTSGPGETFSYSSGSTAMLSRVWQDVFAGPQEAALYPQEALFTPLGMSSAVLEADASGTFVGSSYLYASARDWARFGEFLRNDGVWEGAQLLPAGFVDWMRQAAPASNGAYARGHMWLQGPGEGSNEAHGLPADTFWLRGHDGQSVVVIPSRGLVIARLGLTPSRLGYQPQRLVKSVIDAL